jgi:hypothetical protein
LALPNKATVPNNISNGDAGDPTIVMANFTALAAAINLPWAPDQGYDDLDYAFTRTDGRVTTISGTRSGTEVYREVRTYTDDKLTQIVVTVGPSGSQVTKTHVLTWTDGRIASIATT